MYKIDHTKAQSLQFITLKKPDTKSYAKISLTQGASLNELVINNQTLIEDLKPLNYANTYASSILFPFANRIKDGMYIFNNETYKLDINLKDENNALHGLVYNKTFKVIDEIASQTKASVILEYKEENESKGFPFRYSIQLNYTLTNATLTLSVTIKNTDTKAFPFTLGWHPYFISSDLYNSQIKFSSNKKVILGERLITTGVEDFNYNGIFDIKDQKLDDCFILNANTIQFVTPTYQMEMTASSNATFLQLFTPSRANTIAIEPTTGISDSFNNKIGLQILDPNNTYTIDWNLTLQPTN